MDRERALFIATTPLTILVAAGVATRTPGTNYLLIVADFRAAEAWKALLIGWRGNPFEQIRVLPGRATLDAEIARLPAGRTKRRWKIEKIKYQLRQEVFHALAVIDGAFLPTWVYVGNDRRPETQFAIHCASQRRGKSCGAYLDDGLFSYIGDVHSRWWAKTLFDTPLKKMLYGTWWHHPAVVGSSRHIARQWLAFPELRLAYSSLAQVHALAREDYLQPRFIRLAVRAWCALGGAPPRKRYDALIALPHSHLWQDGFESQLQGLIARLAQTGAAIGIKCHPRETKEHGLTMQATTVDAIPAGLAFELALPWLKPQGMILGQASTALLAAKWLRPSCTVIDLGFANADFGERASLFLQKVGVKPRDEGFGLGDERAP